MCVIIADVSYSMCVARVVRYFVLRQWVQRWHCPAVGRSEGNTMEILIAHLSSPVYEMFVMLRHVFPYYHRVSSSQCSLHMRTGFEESCSTNQEIMLLVAQTTSRYGCTTSKRVERPVPLPTRTTTSCHLLR